MAELNDQLMALLGVPDDATWVEAKFASDGDVIVRCEYIAGSPKVVHNFTVGDVATSSQVRAAVAASRVRMEGGPELFAPPAAGQVDRDDEDPTPSHASLDD